MNSSPRRLLPLAFCLATTWLLVARADPPPAVLRAEAVADFEWFNTLGFPDVRNCPAARVATGQWSQSGSQPPRNRYITAFLLRHDGEGRFTVLTSDLFTREFTVTKPGTPEHEQVGYEEKSLAASADAYLEALAQPTGSEMDTVRARFGERLAQRVEVFTWAWACWRNGLDGRAAALYDRAAALPSRHGRDPGTTSFRERLEQDLGYAMIWRATLDFEDPIIPRKVLLERFEQVTRNFPRSEYAGRARETAELLRTMVAEDAAHAAKPITPLESLPAEERVAELIFHLRDQNGHQFSQPGSCDIFDDFGGAQAGAKQKDAAHELLALGNVAVPQLIAALDNKRFSRSVGFWRDFTFSHHVLTVGDCAQQILQRIAGRSFFTAKTTSSYMSKDGETVAVKTEVEAWWKTLQEKGEKQTLIDAASQGGQNGAEQARVLQDRYPDAALVPILQGAKNSSDPWSRTQFVQLAGAVPGEEPTPFLEEEMRTGPYQSARLMAARALRQRGRGNEAVAAMVGEWEHRCAPGRGENTSMNNSTENLIIFLATSGRVDAIAALGRDLHRRPVDVRLQVVSAMYPGDEQDSLFATLVPGRSVSSKRDLRGEGADDDEKVNAAIEALLAGELDDTEERIGMSGTRNGKDYTDPRVCDFAGEILALRFKEKYSFDRAAGESKRERARIACLNVWRTEQGQELLPLPAMHQVVPAAVKDVRPPLEVLSTSKDESERRAAVDRLTKLGLSALGPMDAFAAALPAGDPGRARIETLETCLACTLADATLEKAKIDEEQWRWLRERLEAIKGKPLSSTAFVSLAVDLAWKMPEEIGGFEVRAVRDDDLSGVRIVVKLHATERGDERSSSDYKTHTQVSIGGTGLGTSSGSAVLEYLRDAGKQYGDFTRRADRALGAAANQPFALVISAGD